MPVRRINFGFGVRPVNVRRGPRPGAAVAGGLLAGAALGAVAAASRPTTVTRHHYPGGYTETVYDGGPRLGWKGGLIATACVFVALAIILSLVVSYFFFALLAGAAIVGGVALTVHLVEKRNERKAEEAKQGQQAQPSIQDHNKRESFTGEGQTLGNGQQPDANQNSNTKPNGNVSSEAQANPAMKQSQQASQTTPAAA